MEAILNAFAFFLVFAALLPWFRQGDWWIRVFDFPRLQLVVLGALVLLGYRLTETGTWGGLFQVALAAATLYQASRIYPYSPWAPKQVADATEESAGNLRLLLANVYMPNRRADELLALVREHRPHLLLALETDEWWAANLAVLKADYPHVVEYPLPNTYGMLLYSRLPLLRPEVRFLLEDDVPSIMTAVELPELPNLQLYCLHPRPPRPTQGQDSTQRDAELVLVAYQVRGSEDPVIVAGDLNDVAWSYTTDLFQRISRLVDPRRGRGMYNTFHAKFPLLRFPLDHVFHTGHFRLVRLARLRKFGSDHFPVLVELSFERHQALSGASPEADRDEMDLGRTLIERGRDDSD